MTTEAWVALAGAIFAGASALVGFATVFISLGRWGQRLESRVEGLEARIGALGGRLDALNSWAAGFSREVNRFLGLIVTLLHRRQALDDAEMGMVTEGLAGLSGPAVEALFQRERGSGNPLAPEEWQRLRAYVDRARRGESLSEEEAREFNSLVSVLERERPADPGVWPLVFLGAYLEGLTLGTSSKQTK